MLSSVQKPRPPAWPTLSGTAVIRKPVDVLPIDLDLRAVGNRKGVPALLSRREV
jgi:hypothetical protein